jgi:hypothetical protein
MRLMAVAALAGLLGGCAGGTLAPSRSQSGAAGGVSWEVRDVVRNAAQGGWDYSIVLTERAGIHIQFQRQEVGAMVGDTVIRPFTAAPFVRDLGRHEKFRLRLWTAGFDGDETRFMVWRRFLGEDAGGRNVVVDVQFYPARLLDPSAPAASGGGSRDTGRSATERLKELDGLRQQQLISEEEYQANRKRILEGL